MSVRFVAAVVGIRIGEIPVYSKQTSSRYGDITSERTFGHLLNDGVEAQRFIAS